MKLYLLRKKAQDEWDAVDAYVIWAADAKTARLRAQEEDEKDYRDDALKTWINPDRSSCNQIKLGDTEKVIFESFQAG